MDALIPLFGSLARVKILRLFVFNRTGAFTLAEIAHRTKLSQEAARSELAHLYRGGIIRRSGKDIGVLYRFNPRYPHLEALSAFVRSTTVIAPSDLLRYLKRAGALRLVVLSGVFTGATESSADILIVGDRINERALAAATGRIEAELGREVRYAAFSTEDFSYRLGIYDRLIRDIFDYPHQALLDRIGL